jgi:hypothetical protein
MCAMPKGSALNALKEAQAGNSPAQSRTRRIWRNRIGGY